MTIGCLQLRLRAVAYICMSAQNAACPAQGEQAACGPWSLMRVSPPLSVPISRAAPFPGTRGPRFRQSAAEEGGVRPVLKRRGHVHLLRPAGDPCFLEHGGKAPLLAQHAGDELLLIGTGRRPSASSDCVPDELVRG